MAKINRKPILRNHPVNHILHGVSGDGVRGRKANGDACCANAIAVD
jgi:hypothetical protein